MASVGSVSIQLTLDRQRFDRDLQALKQLKLDEFKLSLTPQVDHRALTQLNRHLDLKQQHWRQLRREFSQDRLTPSVDIRGIQALNRELRSLRQLAPRGSLQIAVNHQVSQSLKTSSLTVKTDSALLKAISELPEKLADKVGKGLSQGKGGIGGALGSIIGAPLRLLGGVGGGLAGGAFLGIGQQLTSELGKGLSQGLAAVSQETIGSSKLLGRKLVTSFVSELAEDVDALAPEMRQAAQDFQKQLRSFLGAAEIEATAAAARGQRAAQERQQKTQAFEQFVSERRQTIRELPDARLRQARVTVQQADLQTRQQQLTQERQGLRGRSRQGLSREDVARFTNERRQQEIQSYTNPPELEQLQQTLARSDISPEQRGGLQKALSQLEAQQKTRLAANQAAIAKLQARPPVSAETVDAIDIQRANRAFFEPQFAALNQRQKALEAEAAELNKLADSVNRFFERGRIQKQAVQGLRPKSEGPQAYRQILQEVAKLSGVSVTPEQIPQLKVVPDLKAQGVYSPDANQIQVRPELFEGLQQGQLTSKQTGTLVHELRHAVQDLFGSAQGVAQAFEGETSIELLQGTVDELRKFGNQIEASVRGGKGRGAESLRAIEQDAYVFESRFANAIHQRISENLEAVQLKQKAPDVSQLVPNFLKNLKESQSIGAERGIDVQGDIQAAFRRSEEIYREVRELQALVLNADLLPTDKIADVQRLVEAKLIEAQAVLDREARTIREKATGETAGIARRDVPPGGGLTGVDPQAGTPRRVVTAALRVGESALAEGYQKAAGTIVPAAKSAASGLTTIAKSGYSLATKLESVVFDLFTPLKAVKTVTQMVGGPLAAYGVATHLGPAGQLFGAATQGLAHLGIDPMVQSGVQSATHLATGFIQSFSDGFATAIKAALPFGFKHAAVDAAATQFSTHVAAQIATALKGVGDVASTAISVPAAAVGGGALAQNLAKRSFKAAGGQVQKRVSTLLPSQDKTDLVPFEPPDTSKALKEFAYELGAATRKTQASAKQVASRTAESAGQFIAGKAESTGQFITGKAQSTGQFIAGKAQSGLESAGQYTLEKVAEGLKSGATAVARQGENIFTRTVSGGLQGAAESIGRIDNSKIRAAAEAVVNQVRDRVETAATGAQTISVTATPVSEEPRLLTKGLPQGVSLNQLGLPELTAEEGRLQEKLKQAQAAEAAGGAVLAGSDAIARDLKTIQQLKEKRTQIETPELAGLVSEIQRSAQEIQNKFRGSYDRFKKAVAQGNHRIAAAHADTIRNTIEGARKDVESTIQALKQSGLDVSVGSKLGGQFNAILATYTKQSKGVERGLSKLSQDEVQSDTPTIDVKPISRPVDDLGADLESQRVDLNQTLSELNETIQQHTTRLRQFLNSPQGKALTQDLLVNSAGFAASQIGGHTGGIVGQLSGDLIGALMARQGLALAGRGSVAAGGDLKKDILGYLVGNLTSLGTGIPGSGALAASLSVPHLAKLGEAKPPDELGSELESLRVDLHPEELEMIRRLLLESLDSVVRFDQAYAAMSDTPPDLQGLNAINQMLQQAVEAATKFDAVWGVAGESARTDESVQTVNEYLQRAKEQAAEFSRILERAVKVGPHATAEQINQIATAYERVIQQAVRANNANVEFVRQTGRSPYQPSETMVKDVRAAQYVPPPQKQVNETERFDQAFERGTQSAVGAERALNRFERAEAEVQKRAEKVNDEFGRQATRLEQLQNKFGKLTRPLQGLKGVFRDIAISALALFGVFSAGDIIVELGRRSYQTAKQMEALTTSIEYISGGSAKGAASLAFVRSEVERTSLALQPSIQGFKQFSQATKGTILQGQATRDIFEGVSSAAAVMGLSVQDTQSVYLALAQIAGKGVVSQEELRQQLEERIPGASRIAAAAMGYTQQELNALIETGSVLATDLLPALGRGLQEEFGGGVAKASENIQAAENRLTTTMTELQISMGEFFKPVLVPIMDALGGMIQFVTNNFAQMATVMTSVVIPALVPLIKILWDLATGIVFPAIAKGLAAIGINLGALTFGGVIKGMAAFSVQALALYAALEGLMYIGGVLQNKGGEFAKFGDQAKDGLERAKNAANEAKNAFSELSQPDTLPKITDEGVGGLVNQASRTVKQTKGLQGLLFKANVFSYLPDAAENDAKDREQELKNYGPLVQDTLKQAQDLASGIDTNKAIASIKALDVQIQQLQKTGGDTSGLEKQRASLKENIDEIQRLAEANVQNLEGEAARNLASGTLEGRERAKRNQEEIKRQLKVAREAKAVMDKLLGEAVTPKLDMANAERQYKAVLNTLEKEYGDFQVSIYQMQARGALTSEQVNMRLIQGEQVNLQERLKEQKAYYDQLVAFQTTRGFQDLPQQEKTQSLDARMKLEQEMTQNRISLAQSEIKEREVSNQEILDGVKRMNTRIALETKKATDARITAVRQLQITGRLSEEDAAIADADIQSDTSRRSLAEKEDELTNVKVLRRKGVLSAKEAADQELQLAGDISDMRVQLVENELAEIQAIRQRILDDFDLIVERANAAVEDAATKREVALKRLQLGGTLNEAELGVKLNAGEIEDTRKQLQINRTEIEANDIAEKVGLKDKKQAERDRISLIRERGNLTRQLIDEELQQQRNLIAQFKERVELRKEELEIAQQILDADKQLIESRKDLASAISDYGLSQSEANLGVYDRALELVKIINDENSSGLQTAAAREQLAALGYSQQASELDVLKQKQSIEDQIANEKLKALIAEQQIARDILAIEIQRQQLQAKSALLTAEANLYEAQQLKDPRRLRIAEQQYDIAKRQLGLQDELAQNQQLSLDYQQRAAQTRFGTEESARQQRQGLDISGTEGATIEDIRRAVGDTSPQPIQPYQPAAGNFIEFLNRRIESPSLQQPTAVNPQAQQAANLSQDWLNAIKQLQSSNFGGGNQEVNQTVNNYFTTDQRGNFAGNVEQQMLNTLGKVLQGANKLP